MPQRMHKALCTLDRAQSRHPALLADVHCLSAKCERLLAELELPWPAGTAAILAVAGSKPTVTADAQGRIGVERQMRINLTCDHRIVYGSQAAEFMQTLKAVLESPDQLTY